MTSRRLIAFVLVVALVSVGAALAARAQQATKLRRIGVLTSGFKDASTPGIAELTRGLRDPASAAELVAESLEHPGGNDA